MCCGLVFLVCFPGVFFPVANSEFQLCALTYFYCIAEVFSRVFVIMKI